MVGKTHSRLHTKLNMHSLVNSSTDGFGFGVRMTKDTGLSPSRVPMGSGPELKVNTSYGRSKMEECPYICDTKYMQIFQSVPWRATGEQKNQKNLPIVDCCAGNVLRCIRGHISEGIPQIALTCPHAMASRSLMSNPIRSRSKVHAMMSGTHFIGSPPRERHPISTDTPLPPRTHLILVKGVLDPPSEHVVHESLMVQGQQ